jgi:hypothetical protein
MLHPAARHERAQRPDRLVRRCPAGRGSPWRAVTEWTRASVPPRTAATPLRSSTPAPGGGPQHVARRPRSSSTRHVARGRRDLDATLANQRLRRRGRGRATAGRRTQTASPPVLLEQRHVAPSTRVLDSEAAYCRPAGRHVADQRARRISCPATCRLRRRPRWRRWARRITGLSRAGERTACASQPQHCHTSQPRDRSHDIEYMTVYVTARPVQEDCRSGVT